MGYLLQKLFGTPGTSTAGAMTQAAATAALAAFVTAFTGTPVAPQVVQNGNVYYAAGKAWQWTGPAMAQTVIGAGAQANLWKFVAGPTSNQIVVVNMADYGVVADARISSSLSKEAGTDNGPALMAMRARLQEGAPFESQPHYSFVGPTGGDVAYSNSRWLFGFRSFHLNMSGAGYYPIYADEMSTPLSQRDNMKQRTFYNGELLQSNTLDYRGTKEYFNCPKIRTVAAGSFEIRVQNPAEIADQQVYAVGKRITLAGKEVVFNGYPWGVKNFEEPLTIRRIDYESGVILVDRPLKFEYRQDWPECPASSGGGSGIGRIIPLDDPRNRYCQFARFTDGKCYSSSSTALESFAFIANEVVLERIATWKNTTPTENLKSWKAYNCIFSKLGGQFELDKLVGDVALYDCTYLGFVSNGGGCQSVSIYGGTISTTFQCNAPYVTVDGATIVTTPYTTDPKTEGGPRVAHNADPCLSNYPGNQVVYNYTIKNLRLGVGVSEDGVASTASALLGMGQRVKYYVDTVTTDGRIKAYWDGSDNQEQGLKFWKQAVVGMPIFTTNGTKSGTITSIDYLEEAGGKYFLVRISGAWPAVGEEWTWSPLMKVTDLGGHQIITAGYATPRYKRLWAKDLQVWAGHSGSSTEPAALVITAADLDATGSYAVPFDFNSVYDGFEFIVNSPQSQGYVSITINPEHAFYQQATRLPLNSTTPRKVDAYGVGYGLTACAPGQEPDLNQYNPMASGQFADEIGVYCGNFPEAQRTDFTLIIYRRKRAA